MFEDPQLFGKLPGRHKQSMVGQINPIGRRRESYIDAKLSQSIASCKLGLTTTSYSVYRLGNGTCLYKIWAFAGLAFVIRHVLGFRAAALHPRLYSAARIRGLRNCASAG